jgi:hypothetical protein
LQNLIFGTLKYQEGPWEHQIHRPEVWIEKAALLGVIEGICTEYRVPTGCRS